MAVLVVYTPYAVDREEESGLQCLFGEDFMYHDVGVSSQRSASRRVPWTRSTQFYGLCIVCRFRRCVYFVWQHLLCITRAL